MPFPQTHNSWWLRILNSWVFFLLGVVIILALIGPTLVYRTGRTDLGILLLAGHRIEMGQSAYVLDDANANTKSPLLTLLFLPLIKLPHFLAERLWDVLNLATLLSLLWILVKPLHLPAELKKHSLCLMALLFILNPWNQELRLGQFNMIALLSVVLALHTPHAFWKGAALLFALLLKPSNIVFLPWFLRHSKKRVMSLVMMTFLFLGLIGIYSVLFGMDSLVKEFIAWWRIVPLVTQEHIERLDNHALSQLLNKRALLPMWLTPVAVCGIYLFFLIRESEWWVSISIASITAILISPLAWFQNYALFLPLVFLLWASFFSSETKIQRRISALSLAFLFAGLELFNPTLNAYCPTGGLSHAPLYMGLIATAGYALTRYRFS